MDRIEIVTGVSKRLFSTERDLQNTFQSLAALNAELITARQEGGFAIKVGASAVSHFSEAQAHLAAAMEAVARGHDGLAAVKRAIGDQTKLVGGGNKSDSIAPTREIA